MRSTKESDAASIETGVTKTKKDKKKKRKKHKKHKKQKRKDDHGKHESSKTIEEKMSAQPSGKIFIEDVKGLEPEDAFRIDRKPDPNNLAYQSIYKMHIPKYFHTFNFAFGVPGNRAFQLGKRKQNKGPQRYFKGAKKFVGDAQTDEIFVEMTPEKQSGFLKNSVKTEEFMSVTSHSGDNSEPSSEQNERRVYNPLGIYDTATALYVQGKDSKQEVEKKTNTGSAEYERIQRKTADFNKHLRDNPHDVEKWVEFLEFQHEALRVKAQESAVGEKKGRINKVLVDIKLSIMDKALEKNPADLRLKKLHLQLGADIWETSKLSKEWKQLTFKHPNNPDVWWHYLLFLQSHQSSFSVSTVVKAFAKCLSTLDTVRSGTLKSHSDLPHAEEHMMYILNKLALFLKHAGHMERAVAIYQAMIEFNSFCPTMLLQAEKQERLDFLEAFWDSAVPRFGENEAKGWNHWVQSKGEVPFSSMYSPGVDEVEEERLLLENKDRCATWLSVENSRMLRHWLPWRPDVRKGETEEDCEDPERLIMFDDLVSVLFEVMSADNKLRLVLNLLSLITEGNAVCGEFPSQSVLSHTDMQYQLDNFCDAESRNLFGDLSTASCCSAVKRDPEKEERFVDNSFSQAIAHFEGHARTRLTRCWMETKITRLRNKADDLRKESKMWKSACKELKKWIKDILKEDANRNDTVLWEEYSRAESLMGIREDSFKVVDTVLTMNVGSGGLLTSTDELRRCEVCKLCRISVEAELGLGQDLTRKTNGANRQRVLHLLTSLPDSEAFRPLRGDDSVPPTKILKARKSYPLLLEKLEDDDTRSTDRIVTHLPEAGSGFVHAVVCYAYFQYQTVDVKAASLVFQQNIEAFKQRHNIPQNNLSGEQKDPFNDSAIFTRKIVESLVEAHMALLEHHVNTEVSSLRVLRGPLQQAVREFPDNVYLLVMYAKLESRGGIRGTLRRRLHDVARLSSTPVVWIAAVAAELRSLERLASQLNSSNPLLPGLCGPVTETSTKHQLRAWFEKALEQTQNRSCILLWRLYMYTEFKYGDPSAAKDVFYRAVQQCPRAKSVFLDVLQYYPDKLQEVSDLLVEKELRVRTPLEELDLLMANRENISADANCAASGQDTEPNGAAVETISANT